MSMQIFLAQITEMIGALAVTMLFGLIPKLKSVPVVGFKYARREAVISGILLVVFLVMAYFSFFQGGFLDAATLRLQGDVDMLVNNAVVALAAVAIVIGLLWFRRQPVRSTGWHPALWRIGLQVGIALAFLALFLRAKIFSIMNGLDQTEISALVLWLMISFAEETTFRGYIQMRFSSFLGQNWGWLLTAGIYTAWQIPLLVQNFNLDSGFGLTVLTLLLRGLLLGWMMQKCRHVLAPAIYHAFSGWMNYLH